MTSKLTIITHFSDRPCGRLYGMSDIATLNSSLANAIDQNLAFQQQLNVTNATLVSAQVASDACSISLAYSIDQNAALQKENTALQAKVDEMQAKLDEIYKTPSPEHTDGRNLVIGLGVGVAVLVPIVLGLAGYLAYGLTHPQTHILGHQVEMNNIGET